MFSVRKNVFLLVCCLMFSGVEGKINVLFNSFFSVKEKE